MNASFRPMKGLAALLVAAAIGIAGAEAKTFKWAADSDPAAPALLGTEPDPLGLLNVVTTPAGALVTIDGVPVGTTPLSRPVRPGKHKVHVAQAGYADAAPVWVEVPPNGAVEHRPRLYEIPARDRPNRSASEGTGTNVQIVR